MSSAWIIGLGNEGLLLTARHILGEENWGTTSSIIYGLIVLASISGYIGGLKDAQDAYEKPTS